MSDSSLDSERVLENTDINFHTENHQMKDFIAVDYPLSFWLLSVGL